MPVRPSAPMEQLGSHWMDFHEIWCLSIFLKTAEKIPVSLQLDKNYEYFLWRPLDIFYDIFFSSS